MNRKEIALKSSTINLLSQFVGLLVTFVSRKLFIHFIGIELLGLNTVLTDVLGMLALSELGVGSAIIYRLYKPISTKNYHEVNEIISLYKFLYRMIGIIILVLGTVLLPFLKYFISDISVSDSTMYIAYMLMLLSSAVTYFFSYKRTLLYTDQKQYIIVIIDTLTNIGFNTVNFICLFIFRNYYLYMTIFVFQQIFSNVMISIYCNRTYNWLDTNTKFSSELRLGLFKDTKNILFGKFGGYIFSASDTLILSSLVSTVSVGFLGNYKSITGAVSKVITCLLEPIQPLIGNYIANESKESAKVLFHKYGFIRYALCVVLLIPTMCLTHLCVTLWLGQDYIMSTAALFLLVANLYISFVHGPTGEYIGALGLFQYDKYVYFLGAICNVIISVSFTFLWGLEGVLLGTVISQLIMWIGRSYIVYKYYFENTKSQYYKYWLGQMYYFLLFSIYYFATNYLSQIVQLKSSILLFIIRGILCTIIPFLLLCITFFRTTKFQYAKSLLLRFTPKNIFKKRHVK